MKSATSSEILNFQKLGTSEVFDFTSPQNKSKKTTYKPLFSKVAEEEDNNDSGIDSEEIDEDDNISISSIQNSATKKRKMEEQTQKEWLLNELSKMGNRRFNSSMPLQELEFYYSQQKREQDKQNSVRFFKDILCIGCNGIEMLSKWTKIGRLDGWSNSITNDMGRFDNCLSGLYDRYFRSGGSVHPLMELLFVLVSSMVVWHFKGSFLPVPPSNNVKPQSNVPFDIPISIDHNTKKTGGMPRLNLNKKN